MEKTATSDYKSTNILKQSSVKKMQLNTSETMSINLIVESSPF